MQPGLVSLVGAGPGDPGLITVKGLRRLREADVVIYDRLVPQGLLAEAPAQAERIFAGPFARGRVRDQDRINDLLVAKATAGKRVVRLKGGDPMVFGRGSEEAVALQQAGIPWEVVPGVTSPVAALAYAGIPVTDRHHSSSFAVVTGRVGGASGTAAPWRALVGRVDTLVFLMATAALQDITDDLLAGGLGADTPAAVVQRGTTARQRTVRAGLAGIARATSEAGVRPPSILVVGGVASFADDLSWYERLPLFGLRVGLAGSQAQAEAWGDALANLGAEVVRLVDEPSANSVAALREVLDEGLDLVCYGSPGAVGALTREGDALRRVPAAATGAATARAAREAGLAVAVEAAGGDSLAEAIAGWWTNRP